MAINEQEIQEIVRSVLKGMGTTAAAPAAPKAPEKKLLGIFETADEAIAAAKAAQKEIQPMPLEFREKIIANIRKKTLENAKLLSELASISWWLRRLRARRISRPSPGPVTEA